MRKVTERLLSQRYKEDWFPTGENPIITLQDVTKSYRGFIAVDHLDLDVREGEILGIIGHNGAGKTTTLKMITGLVTPTTGNIKIMGMDIAREGPHIKNMIGYLPEESPFYENMTATEYLMFFSERIAMLMVVTVAAADIIFRSLRRMPVALRVLVQVLAACCLFLGLAGWTLIPAGHCVALGILVPVCVCLGRFTLKHMEGDLGIRTDRLQPGRGRVIHALKSYLFTAPAVFHYLRWYLKWGDL